MVILIGPHEKDIKIKGDLDNLWTWYLANVLSVQRVRTHWESELIGARPQDGINCCSA